MKNTPIVIELHIPQDSILPILEQLNQNLQGTEDQEPYKLDQNLTIPMAAEYTHKTEATLRNHIKTGKLNATKNGKWYIKYADLKQYINDTP